MKRLMMKVADDHKVHPATGYYYVSDDMLVDPETGEVYNLSDVESTDATSKSDYNKKLKNLMVEKKRMAYEDYPDQKYHDLNGKVNPFLIAYIDHMNEFPYMTSADVADCICSTIRELNKKYWFDKRNYDYISEQKIREYDMKIKSKKNQMSLFEYLGSIVYKMTAGGNNGRQYRTGKYAEADLARFDDSLKKTIDDFNYRMKVGNAGVEIYKTNSMIAVRSTNPFIKDFDLSDEFYDALDKCFTEYGYEIVNTSKNGKYFIVGRPQEATA